jgi:ABC-type transporter Mla MlaB component
MLKITRIPATDPVVLKLEGQLLEPWVGEVLGVCAEAASGAKNPCLDLSQVNYVDLPGARLLRELRRRGIEIVAWSRFVQELLNTENP